MPFLTTSITLDSVRTDCGDVGLSSLELLPSYRDGTPKLATYSRGWGFPAEQRASRSADETTERFWVSSSTIARAGFFNEAPTTHLKSLLANGVYIRPTQTQTVSQGPQPQINGRPLHQSGTS